MKKSHAFLIAILITLIFIVNSAYFKEKSSRQEITISRVIDGDTFETQDGKRFRLLNVNTPEKSEKGSELAKNFLAQFENSTVGIEITGEDLYHRTLVRVYSPEYLNLELVKKGFSKKFLVEENELSEFNSAEQFAVENSLGIWKKSEFYGCIETEIFPEEERIILKNNCENLQVKDWILGDESRKKYKFPSFELNEVEIYSSAGENNKTALFWNSNQNVWNNDRDTIYLSDSQGFVVAHHSYGY